MSFPDTRPVVVASHPRSGTHLLMDVLRRHFDACNGWTWWGERLDRLYCSIDELNASRGRLDEATARRILQRTDRPLVKTHAWPSLDDAFLQEHHHGLPDDWAAWLRDRGTFLYTVRDVRDVMASYQFFRDWFEDQEQTLGAFIRGSDTPDQPNRVANWANHVREWQNVDDVHIIRFEDLLNDPGKQVDRLASILDLSPTGTHPLLPGRFSSIWESRMARLFSTRPESTAIIGTGSQDWETALSREDRAFIHQHAGDVMNALGYIDGDDWVDPDPSSTDAPAPTSQGPGDA